MTEAATVGEVLSRAARMVVVYIAGPFRGPTAWHVAENVRAAERAGHDVAHLGAMPLIPHANTAHFDGLLDGAFWIAGTAELLRRCDAILMLPTWRESSGARGEHEIAKAERIPIFYSVDELRAAMVDWLRVRRASL